MNEEAISGLIVLFGATGDLAQREILPALHQLYQRGLLSENFAVMGAARTEMDNKQFQDLVREAVEAGENFEEFEEDFFHHCRYSTLDVTAVDDFSNLKARMTEVIEEFQIDSEIVYFYSIAPQLYDDTTSNLNEAGVTDIEGNHRVMIEKPLGKDAETAEEYHELLQKFFADDQIYYVDHYSGMDFTQNVLATRYYNPIIEGLLNKDYVKNIQISLPETKAIGTRGKFYDDTGALLDMFQSHILQLLTLIGMELPEELTAEEIQTKKLELLEKIPNFTEEEVEEQVVRGQYGPDNEGKFKSYRQEEDVPVDSETETYIALEIAIDTPRWEGVPIYVRTGKSLVEGFNAIDVVLKTPDDIETNVPNRLSFGIRPEKGVSLVLNQKLPKNDYETMSTFIGPDYETIDTFYIASPYENLIADALIGDPTYFITFEQIKEQWRITDSIVEAWAELPVPDFPNYRANTFGPRASAELLAKNGDEWIHRHLRYL